MNITNYEQLNIIRRLDWQPDRVKPRYTRHTPTRIVLHHSWKPETADYNGAKTIEGIYRYHTRTNGFSDIGYHYLISPDGSEIFEGRPLWAVGAHCGGKTPKASTRIFGNTGSIGIMLVGNYDKEPVSAGARVAIMRLLEKLSIEQGIDLKNVHGHCDCMIPAPKTCPGKNLFLELFGENKWEALKF